MSNGLLPLMPKALDDSYIEDVFGVGGHLHKKFPNYTPRQGQIELARAVHEVITKGSHLIAEGPTGTGKSLAYAVPMIYNSSTSMRKCLIVTANIALQEQLVRKDLPLLREILPKPFTFSLMKGRGNYLCKKHLDRIWKQKNPNLFHSTPDEDAFAHILKWSQTTTDGDKSELPFEPSHEMWGKVSTGPDECTGRACDFYDTCYGVQKRAQAQSCQIIVTNYHLLYTHLLLKEATGEDKIMPHFDLVVLDEGHRAADIARDFVGFKVTKGMIKRAARFLTPMKAHATEKKLDDANEEFFRALEFHSKGPLYKTRLRTTDPIPSAGLISELRTAANYYDGFNASCNTINEGDQYEISKAAARLRTLADSIHKAMYLVEPNTAYFINTEEKRLALCSKPVRVDAWVRENLFNENDSVVVTSATLSTGGSFEYVADELGIFDAEMGHFEIEVPSPFDWKSKSLLVVPTSMPDPKDRTRYDQAVVDHIKRTLELSNGRVLGLFTSWRMLNQAYEATRHGKHRILKQGDAPRMRLIEEFKKDIGSSLFGTSSFWEGIDVPGEALSVVIIDKLPFPTPDDPVLDMLSSQDDGTFFSYSIPRALIAWKQGVGRLLRSVSDRGVIVCLDPRIKLKWSSYGKKFYECLPGMPMSGDLEHVAAFLNER